MASGMSLGNYGLNPQKSGSHFRPSRRDNTQTDNTLRKLLNVMDELSRFHVTIRMFPCYLTVFGMKCSRAMLFNMVLLIVVAMFYKVVIVYLVCGSWKC